MDTAPAVNHSFPIDAQKSLDERIRQRAHALSTNPTNHIPHGNIPNTPLTASTISFLLGGIFFSSLFSLLSGSSQHWWLTYQTKFFFVAWSAFHWGEFAVTAGWNLEKCSVDCTHVSPTSMNLVLMQLFESLSFG
jgi:protein-S-isoprenylcysteine O-methyltransferase